MAWLGCDKTDEANLRISFNEPPPSSHPPSPSSSLPPSAVTTITTATTPCCALLILPLTGCLIASTKLVISPSFPFDVWHCFRPCQLRLTSLVVDLFSVSTRGSLTACQSRSLAADLMNALKHALAKTPFSIHAETRRYNLPFHHGTNNTLLLLRTINQDAQQS